jgi:hypothetical protein
MENKVKKTTIAEKWLDRIDRPKNGINRDAVRRMQEDATDVLESYGSYLYIFEDESGLWEKRDDDWYPIDEDIIKAAVEKEYGSEEEEEVE